MHSDEGKLWGADADRNALGTRCGVSGYGQFSVATTKGKTRDLDGSTDIIIIGYSTSTHSSSGHDEAQVQLELVSIPSLLD
jgi:hypothetical protein